MKTLSIVGHKGGVGKTTTAASLAGVFNARGLRVLLVDMDAQRNLSETFLDDWEADSFDLFSILDPGKKKLSSSFRAAVEHVRDGLDIIPASGRLCSLDMTYGACPGREFPVKKALAGLSADYDLAIIDSPAQIGLATSNAITAADNVLIPTSCDAYSVEGLEQIMELIDSIKEYLNPGVKIAGIVRTRYQGRRIVDSMVSGELDMAFGPLLFDTAIRECAALVQAPLMKTDILSYDPSCNGALDYSALADELTERMGL